VRSFSALEEEEFLSIARRPNFYKQFIDSLAPQIYGSDGKKLIDDSFSNFY
jgi:DNA replicative helicase MCM subunit Mcm2 (Cdc46/Mcm family)